MTTRLFATHSLFAEITFTMVAFKQLVNVISFKTFSFMFFCEGFDKLLDINKDSIDNIKLSDGFKKVKFR